MSRRVIVDANIAFRALARSRGDLRSRLDSPDDVSFLAPRFLFVELFKHKDRLKAAMGKPEDELLEALHALHALVASLDFADEASIPIGTWMEAQRLCAPTDPKDIAYGSPSPSISTQNSGPWTKNSKSACDREASIVSLHPECCPPASPLAPKWNLGAS